MATQTQQVEQVDIDEDDDELDLPRVEVDGEVVDGDEIVPASFTYFDQNGDEYEYEYEGEENYSVRRWSDEHHAWLCSSDRVGDEETVETFLMIKRSEPIPD